MRFIDRVSVFGYYGNRNEKNYAPMAFRVLCDSADFSNFSK